MSELKIGHLGQSKESLVANIPIEEGTIIYSEKSGMQFVDYAGKRHTYGSIISGIYNEDEFVDFSTSDFDTIISAIKENGFIVDGQIIKVGNTVYQYRNVKGKNLIIKMNETGIIMDKFKIGYAVYLPDYTDGDSVDIDFLIAISNNVYGNKLFYVKVVDNKLSIADCDDMDGTFNPDEFDISIIHNGNGLFTLSTTITSTMNIISCTVSSTGSSIHEEFYIASGDLQLVYDWIGSSTLPYEFVNGSAVIYNGEIHLLGGENAPTNHYKLDGTQWINVSTLPYNFVNGSAVVCEGILHILGSTDAENATKHYMWDGTSWSENSVELPYDFMNGSAVVYRDEIHIFGGTDNLNNHYKLNGNTHLWETVSDLPYEFINGAAVVLNDEIHILGSSNSGTSHYKWNSKQWVNVSTLPYEFYNGAAVIYDGVINLIGGDTNKSSHHKWDGTEWVNIVELPYEFYNGASVVYNQVLQLLGGSASVLNYYNYSKSVE